MQLADNADAEKIDYEICDQIISDEVRKANYKTYEDILHTSDNYYDCIVMMNVLHEIDPDEWSSKFKIIYKKMKRQSYLVFSEVHSLREGERPHNSGYMVLGTEELKELFNVNSDDLKEINIPNSKRNKTICVPIKSDYLKNVSEATVVSAIQLLKKRSYETIKSIRLDDTKKKEYAFFVQQYLNAKLYLESNSENKPSTEHFDLQEPLDCSLYLHDGTGKAISKIAVAKKLRQLADGIYLGDIKVNNLHSALTTQLDNLTDGNSLNIEKINMIWGTYHEVQHAKMNKGNIIMLCELSLAVLGDRRIQQPQIEKHLRALKEIRVIIERDVRTEIQHY